MLRPTYSKYCGVTIFPAFLSVFLETSLNFHLVFTTTSCTPGLGLGMKLKTKVDTIFSCSDLTDWLMVISPLSGKPQYATNA